MARIFKLYSYFYYYIRINLENQVFNIALAKIMFTNIIKEMSMEYWIKFKSMNLKVIRKDLLQI